MARPSACPGEQQRGHDDHEPYDLSQSFPWQTAQRSVAPRSFPLSLLARYARLLARFLLIRPIA